MEANLLFLLVRFPELESPRLSKVLRSTAFAYPFLFDNLPLFYRVSTRALHQSLLSSLPSPGTGPWRPAPSGSLFSYQLQLCWGRTHSCGQEALSSSHTYHLLCALLTGFLFAARLPERLAPGRFDYIGEHKPGSGWPGRAGRLEHGVS